MSARLKLAEQIVDASGAAATIEALLPVGVRPRQLTTRTLLVGMILTMLDGRQALLSSVHRTLLGLDQAERSRLGVSVCWRTGEHQLSYRQLEYTYRLICRRLAKDSPDGAPSQTLQTVLDALLEASVTVLGEPSSSSYALDWTAQESWSRPPPKPRDKDSDDSDSDSDNGRRCADPEASWGHRNSNHPAISELFFGYYLQALTSVPDEHGPDVPELARRMRLASCRHDPPAQIIPVIQQMTSSGVAVSDLLADSGYAHRLPETFALPARALGASLIIDLHPQDRGPKGTHQGAITSNGALYCPATPAPLLNLGPLHRAASKQQTLEHDRQCAQLAAYKLSPISSYDRDGYRRVSCPAAQNKIRCPHRPASMTLDHEHPTIHTPPQHPPICCQQQTITVPPTVNAKTAQKHDYPSPAHRSSYNRRTAAERTFATLTDRTSNDLSRGFCRLMGLTTIALMTATAIIARNIRINDAFTARQADNHRRATLGIAPKQRKRRRHTLDDLTTANAPPEPAAHTA